MKAVVVGAGVYGSGIALALRDLGAAVTVLESRAPAHAWAASGGRERVLRLEYGGDVFYTRLAARAREAWCALETRLGVPLYRETGVLYLAPDDRGWEKASFDTARAEGHPLDPLSPADVERRWPLLRATDVGFACFQPVGGFLSARAATAALASAARDAGAEIVHGAEVSSVEIASGRATGVRLADGRVVRGDAIVLAPGAWAARLLEPLGLPAPKATRQVVVNLATDDAAFGPDRFPVFAELSTGFYGTPAWTLEGVKLANHLPGPPMDPSDEAGRSATVADLEPHREWLARRIPSLASARAIEPHVCCYSLTPDEHFLIGPAAGAAGLFVATGFSGHGFKFASVLAPAIAELATGREPSVDLARFRP